MMKEREMKRRRKSMKVKRVNGGRRRRKRVRMRREDNKKRAFKGEKNCNIGKIDSNKVKPYRTASPCAHRRHPPHHLAPSPLLGCLHVHPVQLLGADDMIFRAVYREQRKMWERNRGNRTGNRGK
jgi:hypothetical protein